MSKTEARKGCGPCWRSHSEGVVEHRFEARFHSPGHSAVPVRKMRLEVGGGEVSLGNGKRLEGGESREMVLARLAEARSDRL